ncbi:MAG: prepilin-type N-terminal cleavage/methylation domain-containing protein [Patescibacteria group bacterium]|nr:prepilin-type N-terminal cleavage/methylation domain-containing protein [Patescibacteria group bacterium]MCL5224431.1 prepilin-type N-terminal cleavage/methylation domain-containing protein [Patescibacteria group bacterium]
MNSKGFTLIELIVVVAILSVVATVVVVVLNPGELLAQSRDSCRLSDLSSLSNALTIFSTDQYSQSMGVPNTIYVSVPDNASSTCGNLDLPTPPSGYTYHCASTTYSANVNGTGWLPVNLTLVNGGSPLVKLPIDPTNSTSSGLYYTYVTDGVRYELTGMPESVKFRNKFKASSVLPAYPGVLAYGTNLAISPIYNSSGLVGYWPLDGNAKDLSGNGNNGTWNGGTADYGIGRVGSAALFNASSYISMGGAGATTTNITASAWINMRGNGSGGYNGIMNGTAFRFFLYNDTGYPRTQIYNVTPYDNTDYVAVSQGSWHFVAFTYDGQNRKYYVDGSLVGTVSTTGTPTNTNSPEIGSIQGTTYAFNGLIDDARLYNRALSAAEIRAIYSAEN